MIGVSRQALYTWIAEGKIDAPKTTALGRRTMRFWSKAQIDLPRNSKAHRSEAEFRRKSRKRDAPVQQTPTRP